MILSDRTISSELERGSIKIEPFVQDQLQPCSYDIRLGDTFLVFDDTKGTVIDPEEDNANLMRKLCASNDSPFILHPSQFALGVTFERIGVNERYVAVLNGKSSLGRLGLLIHATAGFIDPGNCLNITLELFNVATMPIILRPGMKIGQIVFQALTEPCLRPYGAPGLGSKYLGSDTVVASKMYTNYTQEDSCG